MNGLFDKIIDALPDCFKEVISRYINSSHHDQGDTSGWWKKKASQGGWQAIYWHNEHYNHFFDIEQKNYIANFLKENEIASHDPILDIGCGIGRLSRFFSDIGYKNITAVDFPEMIAQAELHNSSDHITYVKSAAQDFIIDKKFKFIISSGCFSSICKEEHLFRAIENCTKMQRSNGYILMIDPFHRIRALSHGRAKIAGPEIMKYMRQKGYELTGKSGMLFFPVKLLITDKREMSEKTTKRIFYLGEKLLALLSRYYWSDYKIMSFRKK